MAGFSLKLCLDEDVSHPLTLAIRNRGWDVLTSLEAAMNGSADEEQLVFAKSRGRAILTSNACDYARLHSQWLADGKTHEGILIVQQQRYSTGEIVRRLLRFSKLHPEPRASFYYLSNY